MRTILTLLGFAACVAAFANSGHTTTDADVRKIENNLAQFNAAGQQVLLVTGKAEARYADIVGRDKYIIAMKPINGEDYTSLVVTAETTSLSVKTADGREIVWPKRR